MNASVNQTQFQVEQNNYVDLLVAEFNKHKQNLIELDAAFQATTSTNMSLLRKFNITHPSLEKTLHLLNVDFWGQVYQRSNIATFLDAEKRKKWSNDLYVSADNNAELPEFNRDNILSTLKTWYESRTEFFADRIDLVFRSLSQTHITNEPQGFSKKMIFTYAGEPSFSDRNTISINYHTRDILYDLACVIAVILNIPAPPRSYSSSFDYLTVGTKHKFFGDTIEIQVFKNGNMHAWIHPEIAIDLNLWLAKKYPSAIASEHRTKPEKIREFSYSHDYLKEADFDLLLLLSEGSGIFNYLYQRGDLNANGKLEAIERFAKFSGMTVEAVKEIKSGHKFGKVAKLILRNGYPNVKDHQFYPTPTDICEAIHEHLTNRYTLEELERKKTLEPSAGTGNLAKIHPIQSNVTCVEVSPIFASILRAKGFWFVDNSDFMKFKTETQYELVLMNPPYKQKQLESHLSKALSHLISGGELIAIVPQGKVNSIAQMKGFENLTVIANHESAFEDTRISTAVISVIK